MVATRTVAAITGTITQSVIAEEIKTRLQALGYTLVDDYLASTDRVLIFSVIFDGSKTFGTLFLKINITSSLVVTQRLGTGFNTSTKVLADEGTNSGSVTFSSSAQLDVRTYLNAPEYRLLMLSQGSGLAPTTMIGIIRPNYKPSWWDENNFPYGFCCTNTNGALNQFNTSTKAPFSTTLNIIFDASSRLSTLNSISLKRDLIPGIILYLSSNNGIAGRLSEDFALIAGSSADKYGVAEISPGVEEYDIVYATTGGLAIRTI